MGPEGFKNRQSANRDWITSVRSLARALAVACPLRAELSSFEVNVGIQGHTRQTGNGTDVTPDMRPIVAFDFDGTLTVRDSFNAYLRWRVPKRRFLGGLARLAPAFAAYAHKRDRGRLKAAAIAEFLAGRTPDEVREEAGRFCDAVWDRFMRPDALAAWNDWKARGATMVIVTASPAITVEPFARRLGADELLGTRLQLCPNGKILGPLEGENCRAGEKVVRLRERFGPDVALAAAYGDTSGDTEMLEIAAEPGFRVFKGRP